MSQRQRSHELRLEIGAEADALLSQLGVEAYQAARQRAYEASSDAMARDWSGVAAAIQRRTRVRRPSLFSMMLH